MALVEDAVHQRLVSVPPYRQVDVGLVGGRRVSPRGWMQPAVVSRSSCGRSSTRVRGGEVVAALGE